MNAETPRAVVIKYAVIYFIGHAALTALSLHAMKTGDHSGLAFWLNAWFGPTLAIACYAETRQAWNGDDIGSSMTISLPAVYLWLAIMWVASVVLY